ncbi:fructose-bisphosphate aldolase A [Crotalus adamanteus]|uniref:fructose-bisphosphate aldolase n=1 Tax=Crotalus adamanteus TaxID=8729 RepID=A0AAW1CBV8_CROAD
MGSRRRPRKGMGDMLQGGGPAQESVGFSCITKYEEIPFTAVAALCCSAPPCASSSAWHPLPSGGQSKEETSISWDALNQCPLHKPWAVTFSDHRALQASALKAWNSKKENRKNAQEEDIRCALDSGLACQASSGQRQLLICSQNTKMFSRAEKSHSQTS